MKTFLAVYTGSPTSPAHAKWAQMDEAAKKKAGQEGMMGWTKWAQTNAKVIASMGGPLGKTKRVDSSGIADISNNLAAYTVVQAESHEAAAKLFLNHPHFAIFPGDGVEIMEVLPIPGM